MTFERTEWMQLRDLIAAGDPVRMESGQTPHNHSVNGEGSPV